MSELGVSLGYLRLSAWLLTGAWPNLSPVYYKAENKVIAPIQARGLAISGSCGVLGSGLVHWGTL